MPVCPGDRAVPGGPVGPLAPVAPRSPVAPLTPGAPFAPRGPAWPLVPFVPRGPAGHRRPGRPARFHEIFSWPRGQLADRLGGVRGPKCFVTQAYNRVGGEGQ